MDKRTVQRNIESSAGKSFLNITEISRYLGTGRDFARKLMKGAEFLGEPAAGRRRYFSGDIAERIIESAKI